MLWDSGYSDAVAARPEGVVAPSGLNVGRMPRTLASQLTEIGLTPSWDHRRVPAFNYNREQTVASMEKVAQLLTSQRAELWINHDRAQSARIPRSPQYVE